jgi:hypothetical protein
MLRSMLIAVAFWALGTPAMAADPAPKEITVTGTLVCAKCKLKAEGVKTCTNALVVKEGEKSVTYILKDKGDDETYHECGGGEKLGVTVAGTLSEKDGKKLLTPTKVTVKK